LQKPCSSITDKEGEEEGENEREMRIIYKIRKENMLVLVSDAEDESIIMKGNVFQWNISIGKHSVWNSPQDLSFL